jgi:hypothetical protein
VFNKKKISFIGMPQYLSNSFKGKYLTDFQCCNEMQPKVHSSSFVHLGGIKKACGNCEMGQGQYDDHKHFTHKSPMQARKCKWLMQMELILAHKHGLELLH